MKITKEMKDKIIEAIEKQLEEFGNDPKKIPTEFVIAFPQMSDEPTPFTMRFRVDRPYRSVPTGPTWDRYKSGYAEYYGIPGRRAWK